MHTPEDVFLLLGFDANAVVANVERAQRLLGIGRHGFLIAHLYPAWRIGPGVLDSVADQIDQHFLQPDPIAGNSAQPHRTA